MTDNLQATFLPSGTNKTKTPLFLELIRKNKKFQKIICSFALGTLSFAAVPNIANASETSVSPEGQQRLEELIKNYEDEPELTKIINDYKNGNAVSRFIHFENENKSTTNPDLYMTALSHDVDIINPFTKQPETISILIEQGNTIREVNFLKKLIKMGISEINYNKITQTDSYHGPIIFSAMDSRDKEHQGGFYNSNGLVFIKYEQENREKEISSYLNTFFHEIAHSKETFNDTSNYKVPIQFEEARARTIAFLEEIEYKENNPDYQISDYSVYLNTVYQKIKDKHPEISNNNLAMGLFLTALHFDDIHTAYDQTIPSIEETVEFLSNAELPKALQEEGKSTKYLKNINPNDLSKLLAFEKNHSERTDILQMLFHEKDTITEDKTIRYSSTNMQGETTYHTEYVTEEVTPPDAKIKILDEHGKPIFFIDMNKITTDGAVTFIDQKPEPSSKQQSTTTSYKEENQISAVEAALKSIKRGKMQN